MTLPQKIPVTVVTGFLGAGKSTLLAHLATNAKGKRLAFLVNEFGDMGVDGEALACAIPDCEAEDMIELANGCICCTVADDFLPAMQALIDRPNPPDHIIIETSGLALPKPLLQAFQWPEVRSRTTVDAVVAVADAPAVAAGTFAWDVGAVDAQRAADPSLDHDAPLAELFEDQMASADIVLVNKTDLADAATLARAEAAITAAARGRAPRLARTSMGAIDPAVALGLGVGVEDDVAARPSHHDHEDDHEHDDFESITVALPTALETPEMLKTRIETLLAELPDVLRVKGFADVAGKPMRLQAQAVGRRAAVHYDRPWQNNEARASRIVVIGLHGFDEARAAAILGGEAQ